MLLLFWAWTLHFGVCQRSQALAAEAPARRQGMEWRVSTCGDNLPLQTSWPHSPLSGLSPGCWPKPAQRTASRLAPHLCSPRLGI